MPGGDLMLVTNLSIVYLIAAILAAVIAFVSVGYLRALAIVTAVVWFLSVNYDRL